MKATVAIVIDGVLRKSEFQPIPEGIRLYKTLAASFNLVLLADFDSLEYTTALDEFLRVEGLDKHSKMLWKMDMFQGSPRVAQVQRLRNSGSAIEFVIEADPEESAKLMLAGFNVMHFMQAQYARPSWRPDYKVAPAPWDELVRREMQAKVSKAVDRRLQ